MDRWTVETGFETGSDVGTTDSGREPKTIDELYDDCREVLRLPASEYDFLFGVDSNDVITYCGAWPIGCYDDCYIGVTIDAYGAGPLPTAFE